MSSGYGRGGRARSRRRGSQDQANSRFGFLAWIVVAVAVVLVVGMLLGPPTLVSYVGSGSMSPALSTGDGFVAVPAAIAGPPDVGDVVYESETLASGSLVTHRVVAETEEGFITQGDANAVTDQAAGEPVVTPERIQASALTVGGQVLAIPNVGQVMGQDASGPSTAGMGAGAWLVVGEFGLILAGRRIG